MPHFVASDLGLHCLPMSHKKYTRLIWVKPFWLNRCFIFSESTTRDLYPDSEKCVLQA